MLSLLKKIIVEQKNDFFNWEHQNSQHTVCKHIQLVAIVLHHIFQLFMIIIGMFIF